MKRVKKFLSWAAVSSEAQVEKISLPDQLAENRRVAEKLGGVIVGELVVDGQSRNIPLYHVAMQQVKGYYVDEKGVKQEGIYPYALLLDLIAAKAFDVLIYLDRSRIGRDAALSMSVVSAVRAAKLRVYEIEAPPADIDAPMTFTELIVGALNSVQDQKEVEDNAIKHGKGMRGRILSGDFPSNIPWPYVARYTPKGDKYVEIDPQGQAVLQRMAEMYAHKGYPNAKICRELNALGIPSPTGKVWKVQTIIGILKRIFIFAGYVELNRQSPTGREYVRAKSKWPAVISEELAQDVEDEALRRATSRQGFRYKTYRFSGVVVCGECGRNLRAGTLTAKRKDGKSYEYPYYRCSHHPAYIGERDLAEAIEEVISYWRTQSDPAAVLAADQADEVKPLIDIAALRAREKDLQEQIEMADEMLLTKRLTAERYDRQIERIASELSVIQRTIREEASRQRTRPLAERTRHVEEIKSYGMDALLMDDIPTANAWLRTHFRVTVSDGGVDIVSL